MDQSCNESFRGQDPQEIRRALDEVSTVVGALKHVMGVIEQDAAPTPHSPYGQARFFSAHDAHNFQHAPIEAPKE